MPRSLGTTSITTIWDKFDGVVRSSAAEIDPDELNLPCMVDAYGAIVPGNAGAYGHIMISAPGESEETFNLNSTLGVADATGVPAMAMTKSTGAIDLPITRPGSSIPSTPMSTAPGSRGVNKVRRGFNNSVTAVRAKGAPWPG
ncbi:hypothetical protein [Sphingomonas immobilis]|uniref:Uncharacterized protein n=1 Tax=Sphingomonas immobilis TaxID=3063997 RepID=A0ABT9A1K1_9SPHN|nr:hypothetical protein [Sphingomonas sp. CA1-15]MDO7843704.1 hypothetical protein [Sphingomonas sp. CA1-15]